MKEFVEAIKNGEVEKVKYFLMHGTIEELQKKEALFQVIKLKHDVNKKKELMGLLLTYGISLNTAENQYGNTVLHSAVIQQQDLDLVKYLVARGLKPEAKNKNNKIPIDYADKKTDTYLWLEEHSKEKKDFFKNVELGEKNKVSGVLNQQKWYANLKNEKGQTALHVAVLSKELNLNQTKMMIDLLCSFGADINKKNDEGDTPLHCATREFDCSTLARFLVAKGAKTKSKNSLNYTPVELADEDSIVAEWFNQQEKIMQRQLDTESHFFNFERIKPEKKNLLTPYKDKYLSGYKFFDPKKPSPINISNLSSRQLVMVEVEALREMTGDYDAFWGNRESLENVLKEKQWFSGGGSRYGFASGLETLERKIKNVDDGEYTISINSQHNPTVGHVGNFEMRGDVGPYGKSTTKKYDGEIIKKGVLFGIYKVTAKNENSPSEEKCEKELAKLFLYCLKNNEAITTPLLKKYNLYTDKDVDNRKKVTQLLNEVLLLTGIKEIVRRTHGSKVKLPIAIAYIQGLELVADGYLSMKDIFDRNANYGIPTGVGLSSNYNEKENAKEKLRSLNALYSEKYPNAPTKKEGFHKLLLDKYSNDNDSSDTDGEEYLSSDDECNTVPRVFGL